VKGRATCDHCGEPEDFAYLSARWVRARVRHERWCRRCRLPRRALEAWDAMRAAALAVLADLGSQEAVTVLRDARATFDLAMRPPPRPWGETIDPRTGRRRTR
jgi:hypothetical protein